MLNRPGMGFGRALRPQPVTVGADRRWPEPEWWAQALAQGPVRAAARERS
ncbi:MAG: hypothetical protein ACKO2C_07015 [Actinomycetes bacterium]|jgi:hypothetical protein